MRVSGQGQARFGPSDRQTVPLTDAETRALQRVVTRLERLLDASTKFVRSSVEPPVSGSPMAVALAQKLSEPYHMSELLIASAEDALGAIFQIIKTGSLPPFSLYTLLRAAGEATVRCRYLIDRSLTPRERLARSLNERLDNLIEQRKAKPQATKEFQDALERLRLRAINNGIQPRLGKPKGDLPIVGFGSPRRSLTQLFGDHMPAGSEAFRLLSGFTHSRPWVQVRREFASPSSTEGLVNMGFLLDVVLFSGVLDLVLDLHDGNIGHWLHLAGYPADVWLMAKQGERSNEPGLGGPRT